MQVTGSSIRNHFVCVSGDFVWPLLACPSVGLKGQSSLPYIGKWDLHDVLPHVCWITRSACKGQVRPRPMTPCTHRHIIVKVIVFEDFWFIFTVVLCLLCDLLLLLVLVARLVSPHLYIVVCFLWFWRQRNLNWRKSLLSRQGPWSRKKTNESTINTARSGHSKAIGVWKNVRLSRDRDHFFFLRSLLLFFALPDFV